MKKEFWHFAFVASLLAAFSACDNSQSSSGALDEGSSSSLINESVSSSSVVSETSSSSQSAANDSILKVPEGGLFRWVGSESGRVITGLDNGSDQSGYWYTFSDNNDGGCSDFEFPVSFDYYMAENDVYGPLIDECLGFCSNYVLKKCTLDYKPFIAVGFDVAGLNQDDKQDVADVSDWNGLCVAYRASQTIKLKMGLSEKTGMSLNYDAPFVSLPASTEGVVKCFKWSEFKQDSSDTMTGVDAAKELVAVHFYIQGEDKDIGSFNIMSVGSYVEQE